jgi:ABC-type glycerol-3-phosphate transport system substrate-binding protein
MSLDSFQFSRRTLLRGMGLGTAAIGASALLAACTPTRSGGSGGSKDELVIMTTAPPTGALLKRQQELAGDPLGVKLRYVSVADATYPSQAAATQQTGDVPDILQWTSQGAASLIGGGVALLPLNDRISSEDDDFYQQDYDAGTVKGDVYAVGTGVSTRVIAYRGDFAADAGPVPTQWSGDEFLAWAAKLKGPNREGYGWEAKTGDGRGSSNFLPLLWSTGARVVVEDGDAWKIGFTKDQLAQVLSFYSDAVYKYSAVTRDVGGWGYPETDGGFQKGNLASYSAGTFITPVVAEYPDTLNNLMTAPLPDFGQQSSFWEQGGLMIHAQSERQDLAWEYISLIRSKELQDANAKDPAFGALSVRRSSNELIEDPVLKTFLASTEFAQAPEPINSHIYMDAVMYPAMQEVTLNQADPKDAADRAMTAMESVMSQINT